MSRAAASDANGRHIPSVVLLDAMGTLLRLQPPAPMLTAQLAAAGAPVSPEAAAHAFRVEIEYYREHHMEGSDWSSLAALRDRCAAAMHAALPAEVRELVSVASLRDAMLRSLQFSPAPGAADALRALKRMGMTLIVVSNWDISLDEALRKARLSDELDAVITSAAFGAAKPDASIFKHALKVAAATPAEALHVGDSPELDAAGALGAGIRPILIGTGLRASVATISSLCELPGLVRSLREGCAHP